MKYLMHTYLPPSFLRGTVSKSSLKPRVLEGFNSTAPIPPLKKTALKVRRVEGYREDSAENQVMGFRSVEKKFQMGQRRAQQLRK